MKDDVRALKTELPSLRNEVDALNTVLDKHQAGGYTTAALTMQAPTTVRGGLQDTDGIQFSGPGRLVGSTGKPSLLLGNTTKL